MSDVISLKLTVKQSPIETTLGRGKGEWPGSIAQLRRALASPLLSLLSLERSQLTSLQGDAESLSSALDIFRKPFSGLS